MYHYPRLRDAPAPVSGAQTERRLGRGVIAQLVNVKGTECTQGQGWGEGGQEAGLNPQSPLQELGRGAGNSRWQLRV